MSLDSPSDADGVMYCSYGFHQTDGTVIAVPSSNSRFHHGIEEVINFCFDGLVSHRSCMKNHHIDTLISETRRIMFLYKAKGEGP